MSWRLFKGKKRTYVVEILIQYDGVTIASQKVSVVARSRRHAARDVKNHMKLEPGKVSIYKK